MQHEAFALVGCCYQNPHNGKCIRVWIETPDGQTIADVVKAILDGQIEDAETVLWVSPCTRSSKDITKDVAELVAASLNKMILAYGVPCETAMDFAEAHTSFRRPIESGRAA